MSPTTTKHRTINKKTGKIIEHIIWRNGGGGFIQVVFSKDRKLGCTDETDKAMIHNALQLMYYRQGWMTDMCKPANTVIFIRNGLHTSPGENMPHITFAFQQHGGGWGSSQHYHAFFDGTKIKLVTYRKSVYGRIEQIKQV